MAKKMVFQGSSMEWQLNLYKIIERGVRYFPKQEIVFQTYDKGVQRYTYADLYKRACSMANALKNLGLKPGGRVTVCGTNIVEVFESHMAILLAGGVVNSTNPRFSVDYIMKGINRMEDSIAIVDRLLVPLFEKMAPQLKTIKHYIIIPDKVETTLKPVYSFAELCESTSSTLDLDALFDTNEYEAAFHQCTTGTTGTPKACVFSHRGCYLQILGQCMTDAHGFTQNDTILHVIPSYHGFWFYHFTGWLLGMKQVFIGPMFDPNLVMKLIQDEKVTCTGGTPEVWTMALNFMKMQKAKGVTYDLSSLNRIFLAGTAPPVSLQKDFEVMGIKPLHVFGMTEMNGPHGTSSKPKPYFKLSQDERYELMKKQGLPLPLVQVKGLDDKDKEIPWNGTTIGELCLKGGSVLRNHYAMEEESKALWTKDGWFRSGDLITIDPEGYMTIMDRKKDLIKTGGEFISTIELGANIFAHPKVAEAAVVGVSHPKWGERPLALVVPQAANKGDITEEEILKFIQPNVPSWWLPDEILFVDEIPKTSVGKIDKSAIKVKYKDHKLPEVPLYKTLFGK
ncbi:MAG: AMP-binding protein [Dehalococcoidia bacterium]|nr:AMP-binding protein [Dehalococcoidia bacterium]